MSKQNKIILIIAIALIAIGFILMARESKAPGDNGQIVRPIDQTDHVSGDLKAPVKLIIYSDFQCPFCYGFSQTIKKVEQEFKDKVVVAFRHYPLVGHLEAEKAAEASECAAEQGKFWEMHDKLFADNAAGRLSPEQFKQDAIELGLNVTQFNQCLDSGKSEAKVIEQTTEGHSAGVTGAPTSFINGKIYIGAYPFEDFTALDGQPINGLKSIISELLK